DNRPPAVIEEPDDEAEVEAPRKEKFGPGFGFIPFVIYNSDWGVGGGAKGAVYWYAGGIKPYALRVDFQLFITTKLVQFHYVGFDIPRVLGTPLRLDGSVWYTSSLTENYCGLGGGATCSPGVGRAAGREYLAAHGLNEKNTATMAASEELGRKYYQFRQLAPYGVVNARYGVTDQVDLFASYKLQYYRIDPYPLSQLAEEKPLGMRGGTTSMPQLGVVFDTRDHEPAPTFGIFSEVSARVSSRAWGSGYDWFGVNATFRGYAPLTPSRNIVLAMRFIADMMFGNVPFYEQNSIGGSDQITGLGGERSIRGIRASRFRGKGKFIFTPEFRATWVTFNLPLGKLGSPEIDIGNTAYIDVGKVISEWPTAAVSATGVVVTEHDHRPFNELVYGAGAGLRIGINRVFILKGDVAVSPLEPGSPGIYLNVGHVF
ncbi:MAG: BamA/TamA family outer membrane protein, partial [Myxococcota bacterium]